MDQEAINKIIVTAVQGISCLGAVKREDVPADRLPQLDIAATEIWKILVSELREDESCCLKTAKFGDFCVPFTLTNKIVLVKPSAFEGSAEFVGIVYKIMLRR